MQDIVKILTHWAGWVTRCGNDIHYKGVASKFKLARPKIAKSDLACSTQDGNMIEECMLRLKACRAEEYELLVLHYLFRVSKRQLARMTKRDEKIIRIKIQLAERFIEGSIYTLKNNFDMNEGFYKHAVAV